MKNKYNSAFSVAEAFITLIIVSVALAAAAPMVTKQIKYNNLSGVQTNILGREINQVERQVVVANENLRNIIGNQTSIQYAQYINNLDSRIRALENIDIETLQSQINSKVDIQDLTQEVTLQANDIVSNAINQATNNLTTSLTDKISSEIKKLQDDFKNKMVPSGAIVFFDSNSCPDSTNWAPLTTYYPQASGAFIRNLGEEKRGKGSYQAGAVPDIQLAIRLDDSDSMKNYYSDKRAEYGADDWGGTTAFGTKGSDEEVFVMNSAEKKYRAGDLIKTNPDVYDKNVKEVRPNNIAFIACRKK